MYSLQDDYRFLTTVVAVRILAALTLRRHVDVKEVSPWCAAPCFRAVGRSPPIRFRTSASLGSSIPTSLETAVAVFDAKPINCQQAPQVVHRNVVQDSR
jgi:hypothetical protein